MARAIVPDLTRRPEASLSFYRIPGFSIRDHSLSVPLDWSRPEGRAITLFAREVTAPGHERADLPLLVFLQGGPGGKAPRPGPGPAWLPRAAERFRVILLDQRGTGRSSAVQGRQMAAMDAQAGARHLACFHADSIVRDCEYLRQTLFDGRTWFTLGQSYGGFLTLTYLSLAPQGLAGCFVAGGLPGLFATADQVYRRTYPRMAHKNALHVARHPQDRAILDRIADRLAGGDVRLPDGDLLLVWGNCQGESYRRLLGGEPGTPLHGADLVSVRVPPAFEAQPDEVAHLERLLPRVKALVTQPIPHDYRGMPIGTDQLVARLPEDAAVAEVADFYSSRGLLARAQVVGHDEVPAGVVTMNSRVHCREEASGKDYHLTLVYPEDAGGEGKVSILAPVGCALLGLSVGQHIDWPAPGGKQLKLTLLEVEYQPEAAGEYDR